MIGEDLGTVPENFRETLADWGMWSYQVMIFERLWGGAFREPQDYRQNALATFATHDMPTFAGWLASNDLKVKRALGIDPGETDDDRRGALAALNNALFADDTQRMVEGLDKLGFAVTADSRAGTIRILGAAGSVPAGASGRARRPASIPKGGRPVPRGPVAGHTEKTSAAGRRGRKAARGRVRRPSERQ